MKESPEPGLARVQTPRDASDNVGASIKRKSLLPLLLSRAPADDYWRTARGTTYKYGGMLRRRFTV